MDKRQFLKISSGVSIGLLFPNSILAGEPKSILKSDMRWQPYAINVVIMITK